MSIFRRLKIGDGPDCECGISETTAKLIRTKGQQRASIPEWYLTPWKLNESFPDKKGPLSKLELFDLSTKQAISNLSSMAACRLSIPLARYQKIPRPHWFVPARGRWNVNRLPHHTPVARYFEQTTRQERTSTR